MKRKYNLTHKLIASILILSLFLQSCDNASNPLILGIEKATNNISEPSRQIGIVHLPAQELTTDNGYIVTFRETNEYSQASVQEKLSKDFTSKDENLSISPTESLNLFLSINPDQQVRAKSVKVEVPTNKRAGYKYVGKQVILEGMKKEKEEKGLNKERHMQQPADNDLADYQNLLDFAMAQKNPFELCPEEILFMILEFTAIDNYVSDGNTGSLRNVCQDWRRIMNCNTMKESIKNELVYQRFLKGMLVYRPNHGSEIDKINLPISSLGNPLEDIFDLSQCGDTGKYLSISTGYRKEKKVENKDKIEIWLTPRFLVKKEINVRAQHYQEIFPSQWPEEAPISILWSWGSWPEMEWYTYLTTNTMDELANDNLYEKWCKSRTAGGHAGGLSELISWCGAVMQYFHVHFEN